MNITLLCNAGLLLEYNGNLLAVDLPNEDWAPFYWLSEEQWNRLCENSHRLCGFFFTHDHPDHLDKSRIFTYLQSHPGISSFVPSEGDKNGTMEMGSFIIRYHRVDHAPLPVVPPHVTAIIEAGDKRIYVAADAKPDCVRHKEILGNRTVDAAFWNSMYLSHADTRALMASVSNKNYIYHMPQKSETDGMWRKAQKNLELYKDELKTVTVLGVYPTTIIL